MVCLSEGGVVLQGCQVSEGGIVHEIDCKGEEDLVVDENLLARGLVGVQGGQITTHNCDGTLDGSIKEVVVDLGDGTITLNSLHQGLLGEILHHLEFFVPIADSSGIKTEERNQRGLISINGLSTAR